MRLRSERPAASTSVKSCNPRASFPASSKLSLSSTAKDCRGCGFATARCKRLASQPWSTSGKAQRSMSKIKSASSELSTSSKVANATKASTRTPTCASVPGRRARSRPTPGMARSQPSVRILRHGLCCGSFWATGGSTPAFLPDARPIGKACAKRVCFSHSWAIVNHSLRAPGRTLHARSAG